MRKLIDLTKGHERVFIVLNSSRAKAVFLKRATEEGFMIGSRLPSACECERVMIIHPDYTISYCYGMATNYLYHHSQSCRIDYEKYINGELDYLYKLDTDKH
ncbi:MAG: hypothetical protein IJL87_01895 [Clostridia bacterium]|nr:hypothetical protein [Clostridia bacterium]